MTRPALQSIGIALVLAACTGCMKEPVRTTTQTPPLEPGTPPASATIAAVQGHGHTSPLLGHRVSDVSGVVIAIEKKGNDPGFWIESQFPDSDETTSDGIFVSTAGEVPDVRKGDVVDVAGIVDERGEDDTLTVTRIAQAQFSVIGRDKLPTPIVLGKEGREIPSEVIDDDQMERFDPDTDAIDFWESLEGMLVEIHDPLVVGPTSKYGDIVVLADGGADGGERSAVGGVVIREGEFHPNRITLDTRFLKDPPQLDVGDRIDGSVVGVVDYSHSNYRVVVTSRLNQIVRGKAKRGVTNLHGDATHVTIATWNVLNLSAKSSASKYSQLAETIVRNMRSPDIVALEEMQDDSGPEDDGTVSAARTFGRLVDAIVTAGGPRYAFSQIDPENDQDGGQPGANIRVGFLYNPRRVDLVKRGKAGSNDSTEVEGSGEKIELSLSPGRIGPANPCFNGRREGTEPARKPLAAEFRFRGKRLFVIANHLSSKRGDDALFGARQPPQRASEDGRICQATVLSNFAGQILGPDPKARLVILGDMNEHEFRRPLRVLVGGGLENLIDRVPLDERYTFNYEGNSQVLDHILVSPSIGGDRAEIQIVHADADFAASRAASDHDPVVARLEF